MTANNDMTLIIGLLATLLTSPFIFSIYRGISSWFERKYRYPEWAAVFLSDEQVYFGKIKKLTHNDVRIEQVYYLNGKESDRSNSNTKKKNNVELVKLGKEIHGPEDFMLINRSHIIFLESLTGQGEIVRAIKATKQRN